MKKLTEASASKGQCAKTCFGDLLEAVEEECDISDNERQELAPLITALKEYLDG